MAPELHQGRPYTQKADTWAFGCTIFELCALQPAYPDHAVHGFKMRRKLPPGYSKELTGLIDQCLKIAPSSRPNVGELFDKNQTILWTRRSQEWQQRWNQLDAQKRRLQEMEQELAKHREAQVQFQTPVEKIEVHGSFDRRRRSSEALADAACSLQDDETRMESAMDKCRPTAGHITISNVIIELQPTWDVLENFLKDQLDFSDRDREVLIRCRLGAFKKLFGEKQTQLFLDHQLKVSRVQLP
jgi:serine/threonine protein kinase